MEEELYNEFIHKVLRRDEDDYYSDLSTLCSSRKRGDGEWRKHYYFRCLTLYVVEAFIGALSQCRNYITTTDIITDIPFHHFYTTFRALCEALGGTYDRGKCFHFLQEQDWVMFLRLRREERRPEALLSRWRDYVNSVAEQRKRELPQLLLECRRRGHNGAPSALKQS